MIDITNLRGRKCTYKDVEYTIVGGYVFNVEVRLMLEDEYGNIITKHPTDIQMKVYIRS